MLQLFKMADESLYEMQRALIEVVNKVNDIATTMAQLVRHEINLPALQQAKSVSGPERVNDPEPGSGPACPAM